MRKDLGLYANIRPVTTFPSLIHKSPLRAELIDGADFMCIRELTGGMYFGRPQGRLKTEIRLTILVCIPAKKWSASCIWTYKYAGQRSKKVTIVDKANVLATSRLWRQIGQEIAPQYPDIETEFMFVDNAAMRIIQCYQRALM